eukprot:605907_1
MQGNAICTAKGQEVHTRAGCHMVRHHLISLAKHLIYSRISQYFITCLSSHIAWTCMSKLHLFFSLVATSDHVCCSFCSPSPCISNMYDPCIACMHTSVHVFVWTISQYETG